MSLIQPQSSEDRFSHDVAHADIKTIIQTLKCVSYRLPDVYTQFRKQVEGGCRVRQPLEMPAQLNPLPPGIEEGEIPSSEALGVKGETLYFFIFLRCVGAHFGYDVLKIYTHNYTCILMASLIIFNCSVLMTGIPIMTICF